MFLFVYSSWLPWENAEYSANTQTINHRRLSKLIGGIMQMLVKPDVYYTCLFIRRLKPFYQRHTITVRGRWHSFLTPIKGRLCSRKGPRVSRPLLATETASVATGALWPSHLNIVWITCAEFLYWVKHCWWRQMFPLLWGPAKSNSSRGHNLCMAYMSVNP